MPSSTYTTSTSSLAAAGLLLLRSSAAAQLLGCDAVNCPIDEYQKAKCEVGNATLSALGIANFTTSFDSQPLTWTLGLQQLDSTANQLPFDRNYYLGTPPSLELNDKAGCALFFEGISTNLTAANGNQLDKFTCSNALAESCITDLIAQAQTNYKSIDNATASDASFCSQLRDSLANSPPASCNGVKGSWGAINAQPLTGATSINDAKCHPTTGKDYALRLVSSTRTTASGREYSQLAPVLNAVTPVLTVFGKDSEAEAQLTCLKLVERQAGQTVDVPDAEGAASTLGAGSAVYVGLVAMTYLWYVLV